MPRVPRITVVGSCNMDIVAFVERAPGRGETVSGTASQTGPGGKGANQAIAAARLGAAVSLVGAVGDDASGAALRDALISAGVAVSHLRTAAQAPTGTAQIVVEPDGANRIVVVPGANGTLTALTEADRKLLADSDLLLLQLESPLSVVLESARAARAAGTRVLLTPAPARALPPELLASLDVLVPNEHEALQVAGVDDVETALSWLVERVPDVVVTLGERGSVHARRAGARASFPALPVVAVDTTAAGDTFVGALALALGEERTFADAIGRASAAAALSVGRLGASASMPDADELKRLLAGG